MTLSLQPAQTESNAPDSHVAYTAARVAHWDAVAASLDRWHGWGGLYHRRLGQAYRFLVPPGARVLELGCGAGDLLAACRPSLGVGLDFSPEMIRRAARRHPKCRFLLADAQDVPLRGTYDFVILSDLVNDVWDVQTVLEGVRRLMHPRSRLILNVYSRLWEQPLALAEKLGLAKPTLYQNWLTVDDLDSLLRLAGLEKIRHWSEVAWPLSTPVLEPFGNRFLVRIPPFSLLGMSNFVLARPAGPATARAEQPSVSIVVPVRNEAGNLAPLLDRLPSFEGEEDVIFVEGHSQDDSRAVLEQEVSRRRDRRLKILGQSGVGKGDAVRAGFAEATGDILMILDADLSVRPEDLPRFRDALVSGAAEFVNGVRLVYPMEDRAMRFLNLVGNKIFGMLFSWLLGQPVKDTLCGTKALWRSDYERIAAQRAYFGDFDPFGDFDLLFGAARLGLKILDLPIRYQRRTYGKTNIQRWKHGWLLFRM